jgi:hypothetical protein
MRDPLPFDFDDERQVFRLSVPGFPRLQFCPEAVLDGKALRLFGWKDCGAQKSGRVFQTRNTQGAWVLRWRALGAKGDVRYELFLECRLHQRHQSVVLRPVIFEKFAASHVLTHGRKMGGCESHPLEAGGLSTLDSHFFIAISRGTNTLLLSHPLLQKEISNFSGETVGKKIRGLAAATTFEPCHRRVLRSAPLTLSTSTQGQDLLVDWARIQVAERKPPVSPQESGWNTWDYYRWTITEEEVYKNAELIASDPILSRHIKRIIIDDGWQYCYGEWEPNPLFPSGMKKLAANLTRMGFAPGLWFAPTIAEPHSRIAQLFPETLALGASGFPCLAFSCMERKGFILDPTHPRVRAGWLDLFRRYADYGYRYFKLDFLAATVRARTFHKPGAGPGELMRHIIEPIREAVGLRSRILGCNFAFDGGPGLVDDVRISSDIHAKWSCVKENVGSIAARFWAQERFWINDPDFTLCRGGETSNDPHLHQLKPLLPCVRAEDANPRGINYLDSLVDLSHDEAEVLVSLVITSGGAMNLSDNLPRLNERGLDLLRRAVQAEKGSAAIPVDLFHAKYPATWIQKLATGRHRVLLINWADRPASFEVDLAGWNVPARSLRNFWTGGPVPVKGGKLEAHLNPHSCLLTES